MCIFCKIVNGEIPSYKVYEDEKVLAFLDISQVTKGHTLVIPKHHAESIFDLNDDLAAHLFKVTTILSKKMSEALHISNMNILNNSGSEAGQEVGHFHLHLIPIYNKGDLKFIFEKHNYSTNEMHEIASKIKNSGK